MQQLTEKKNVIYKQATDKHHHKMFDLEELVLANLKKERFPVGMHLKLKQKQIGQCKVLKRIKDNAHHSEIYIHNIFIVKDFYQYHEDQPDNNSRVSSFQAGEDDADGESEEVDCIVAQTVKYMEVHDRRHGTRNHI